MVVFPSRDATQRHPRLNPFTYHDENSKTMEVVLTSYPVNFQ